MDQSVKTAKKSLVSALIAIGIAVLILIFFNILCGGSFLKPANINSIIMHAVVPSFIAWGYCFIFAFGFMDLSIYSAVILCAYVAGEFGNAIGIPGILLGGILAGVVLMSLNFNIFAWTKIPSWIGGLGMCLIYEAVAAYYSAACVAEGATVVLLEENYRTLMSAPYVYIILVLGFILAYIIYNRTSLGFNVRAIGSNEKVARGMGINVRKTLILTGLVCGIFIGIAGALQISYVGRIFPMTGLSSLSSIFQPLAAVLLAQVLEKRINIIISIPFCAVFIYACFNLLTMLKVPSGTLQEAALGGSVLLFGIIAQRGYKGVVK